MNNGLIERIYWLMRLRWIAVVGVILTAFLIKNIFKISLPFFRLYGVAAFLGAYNLIFLLYLKWLNKIKTADSAAITNRLANIQISLDLFSLTALLHFSGGIENPFIFYFIFHVIIAGILLPRRAAFFQATLAILLFAVAVTFEYLGVLPHYCLKGYITSTLHINLIYISGVSSVFISTLYIAVYMASSIAEQLREREKSLREANLLLEEKDRIKSEYVLRVSHDIKEHLSAIQSCLEPVRDGLTGELHPKQKGLIDRAEDRTNKLLLFVRALLEVTRIKLRKEIEMAPFSLKKTIENAINFVEAMARDKRQVIKFDMDPSIDIITGAQIYIEETVANLLANSVKYTPNGGSIALYVRDKGNFAMIQINDTGIGIPKDDIPKIFEEFYRAKNAKDMERMGTGLGLSIAKQVVERHKGKIWVESEEGKGSTFYILLPKA